nr:uncharacterized protein LOC111514707 [Leptinotarsa decemlineata]
MFGEEFELNASSLFYSLRVLFNGSLDIALKVFSNLVFNSRENQSLHKRIVTDSRKFEELAAQLNELKKKYAASRADLEREHKRNERLKATYDAKTSDLEKDSDKQKAKIRDLQAKLETALVEIRKNQNLAVSKIPDATAPAGAAQADALHVQVATPGGTSAPPSPDASFGVSFEEAVRAAGEYPGADKILSEYRKLRGEYEAQKQKMVKVKKEQFKACEIIKSMIDSRNQANVEIAELRKKVDETNELRRHVKQLEHELESVVSKPTSDGDETSMQRVANFPSDEVRFRKDIDRKFGKFHFPR